MCCKHPREFIAVEWPFKATSVVTSLPGEPNLLMTEYHHPKMGVKKKNIQEFCDSKGMVFILPICYNLGLLLQVYVIFSELPEKSSLNLKGLFGYKRRFTQDLPSYNLKKTNPATSLRHASIQAPKIKTSPPGGFSDTVSLGFMETSRPESRETTPCAPWPWQPLPLDLLVDEHVPFLEKCWAKWRYEKPPGNDHICPTSQNNTKIRFKDSVDPMSLLSTNLLNDCQY